VGGLPEQWPRGSVNTFYQPLLNVHFFHVAGDSVDNGVIVACRYKRIDNKVNVGRRSRGPLLRLPAGHA